MERTSNAIVLRELKSVLGKEGLRASLAFLNSLTSHRFTSLYRFEGDRLHSITFYDREHPEVQSCEDIPIMASYCVFVRDSGAMFTTHDARSDERVQDHPKQTIVQAYCGVPILNQDGTMVGTVCHFDFQPRHIANLDVDLLESMAELVQRDI